MPLIHLAFAISALAQPASIAVLEEAVDFTGWLESHARDFAACEPVKKGELYELCDGAKISRDELKSLFGKTPQEILKSIAAKGLKIEILCDADKGKAAPFASSCVASSGRKLFQEMTALHGKYLPEEKTILIRSSTTPGSLIHEYLHSVQSENANPVHGKVYKRERNRIQQALAKYMEKEIAATQALQKAGDTQGIRDRLKTFGIAGDLLRNFGVWQDLIDERSLFLLYIKYGSEFGATKEDLDLARKNMGFICGNPKLKPVLPASQCPLID